MPCEVSVLLRALSWCSRISNDTNSCDRGAERSTDEADCCENTQSSQYLSVCSSDISWTRNHSGFEPQVLRGVFDQMIAASSSPNDVIIQQRLIVFEPTVGSD